jgi:hypothetical protein
MKREKMTKRDEFIKMVWAMMVPAQQLAKTDLATFEFEPAWGYFTELQKGEVGNSPTITANGRKILAGMAKMYNPNANINMWTAREIGEANDMATASVSGGMRKLISDGLVKKGNPGGTTTFYELTTEGSNALV